MAAVLQIAARGNASAVFVFYHEDTKAAAVKVQGQILFSDCHIKFPAPTFARKMPTAKNRLNLEGWRAHLLALQRQYSTALLSRSTSLSRHGRRRQVSRSIGRLFSRSL